jgi:hypothetical protein
MSEEVKKEETQQQTQEEPKKTVSLEDHERALADLHKYKSQLRDIETKSEAQREQLLKDNKEFEKLAMVYKQKLEETDSKFKKAQEAIVLDKKFGALKEAAMKAGIRQEAIQDLESLNMDRVEVETTSTGRVNVLGVEGLIENLKMSRPHWFGATKTTVAGGVPNITQGGLVSKEELIKLSLEAQKTGDSSAYLAKFKQYKQQQKRG